MPEMIAILDPTHTMADDLREAFARAVGSGCDISVVVDEVDLLEAVRHRSHRRLAVVCAAGERDALGAVRQVRAHMADLPLVVIGAGAETAHAAALALEAGASDYLAGGEQLAENIANLLARMRLLFDALSRTQRLHEINAELREQMQARFKFVGQSPQIMQLVRQIQRIAAVPRPLLIVGERGTGKELVARAVHLASDRDRDAIITVNCAAFSDTLLESELFGHERGAFTGAESIRRGRFEQANGGTLFLDEIGHMSLSFQQKILRVVEYGTYHRVGGHEELHTNVRVVGATNADMKSLIDSGRFLRDLYDRLTFEVIRVPPLREREGDIEVLATHFLQRFAMEIPAFAGKVLSEDALRVLKRYPFPGNVRELKNIIERAAYRDTTNEITPEDIGMLATEESLVGSGNFVDRVEAFQRKLIFDALEQTGNNQAAAARSLGLSYHQYRYYMKKFNGEA